MGFPMSEMSIDFGFCWVSNASHLADWRRTMKLRIALLSLFVLCLTLAAVPAVAQTLYSNGPINGNTDAWTVNFGFTVSDTFNVTINETTVTGGSFGMWLFSGDTLTSAELSITSGENSGTSYFDQTVSFEQGSCTANQYGYNVCTGIRPSPVRP
jgi:hypothetical protein